MKAINRHLRRSPAVTVAVAIAVGLLLLGGSVGLAMRWPDTSLRAGPDDATRFDDSPAVAPLEPLSDDYVRAKSRKGRTAPARVRASAAPLPSGDPAQIAVPTATPRRSDYPRAASCSVDTAGMTPGETRSCRFTATRAGGWSGSVVAGAGYRPSASTPRSTPPTYTVIVTRNGIATEYGGENCGDDVIEPGDLVLVELSTNTSVSYNRLGAGYKWNCSTPVAQAGE